MTPRARHILRTVSDATGVPEDEMLGRCRYREKADARHIAMWLCYYEIKPRPIWRHIGEWFANRDHSTVIHGVNKVEELISSDPAFCEMVRVIRNRVNEP